MEYHKMINLLDNTQIQPSKFRTKSWFEINDASHLNDDSHLTQVKFKTSILKSNLCDYIDQYILVKGTISVANMTNTKRIFV